MRIFERIKNVQQKHEAPQLDETGISYLSMAKIAEH
jgi:hypothetical protein